ncbi:MAG: DegQ family serine endoprotease [Thiogranum sp.]|nr:DegQ family serine endoprotease [Thiogranum sp.]
MRTPAISFIATLLLLFTLPAMAALPASVEGQPLPTLAPMLHRATPAVVNIATVGHVEIRQNPLLQDPFFRHFFDIPTQPRQRRVQSLGSGVIVDAAKGYVLTNHHVIERADEITVTLRDGRRFSAKLIGTDPDSDIAVVQIPAGETLTELPLADSDDLQVGDFVVAIGNPFGLGQTVTSGIVSALGRTGLGIEGYEDFIQTDASINPGNSGGALVNLRGELVGINTAILAPGGGNVGIGFAIPINMAEQIMQQLVEYGEVSRGQLGVTAQDLTPELAQAFGIRDARGTVISRIDPGSPAEKAGLRVGDVILEINGRTVRNSSDVRNRLGLLRAGASVDITILRDGKKQDLTAVIEAPELDQLAGERLHPRLTGAWFSPLQDVLQTPERGEEGVVISTVEPNSPAWQVGLRQGDIIVSANRQPVATLEAFRQAVEGKRQLLLNIQRGQSAMFVLIQ